MNPFAFIFLLVCGIAILFVPRRWAPIPLLVGCCYMTMGQVIGVGPFNFHLFRVLLGFGLLRVVLKGERIQGRANTIDKMMITWAIWVLAASFFHEFAPGSGPVYALGLVYNTAVSYYLFRVWCRNSRELKFVVIAVAVMLAPIAISMLIETILIYNPFSIFGGVQEIPTIREGRVRASGPFAHTILAGSVGATSLPLMLSIWRSNRIVSMLGIAACIMMVIASASSGPMMSLILGIFAMCMWRFRSFTRYAMQAIVVTYILLSLVMTRPPYFLLSRIDLTGGSTGWHRSILIDRFLSHFHEWWAFGTDYTKHWLPWAPSPSPQHADITNAYIAYAVVAGLPALLLILAILWRAFTWVGATLRPRLGISPPDQFLAWCLGASLFAHATTMLSVSYFDQTIVFFWAIVSMISSFHSFSHLKSLRDGPLLRYRASWSKAGLSLEATDQ